VDEDEDDAASHLKMMQTFAKAVAIFSQLQHPNIVQYIGSTCFFDVSSNTVRGLSQYSN
jgi:hypothetical protein